MCTPDGIILSIKGNSLNDHEVSFFKKTNPFGFILFKRNFKNKVQLKRLIEQLKSVSKNPNVLISVDQEGGRVQRFNNHEFNKYSPQKKFGDLYKYNKIKANNFAYFSSYLLGSELSKVGIDINFSPVCDVHFKFANNVIGDRAFDSDPNIVKNLAKKF